jgi:two-component system OmpR family response regulator
MRVLIVEDNARLARTLSKGLREENHLASIAMDGQEAIDLLSIYEFDVMILDVMLPKIDGFEVALRVRAKHCQVPILFLTARDTVPDVIKGLDLGGTDYMTKPFHFDELLARLRAASRRGPAAGGPMLQVGDLTLDPATREVTRGKQSILLSATEYRLLEFLMRRAGRVVPRNAIIESVWGFHSDIEPNTLDAFVRLLRRKVDGRSRVKVLRTMRGVGYYVARANE